MIVVDSNNDSDQTTNQFGDQLVTNHKWADLECVELDDLMQDAAAVGCLGERRHSVKSVE